MRILVCGGRDYKDRRAVFKALDLLFPATEDISTWLPPPGTVIIHGGAKGADRWADDWAVTNWVKTEIYKADWKKYGRAAGPIRNQYIISEGKPDLVIAFPGGRGTTDMIRRARASNIPVIEITDPK